MTDGFVFLDVETTGMDSDSRVIDIALVQTSRNGELEKIYDSLIHGDGSSGGSRLVSIHHITDEMIEHAPLFDEVWVEIEPLLHNRIIVAHNAHFDRKRINYELARIGVKPLDEFLCTFKLAKFLGLATKKSETSTGTSGKLEALAARFGITIESAHRALPDTKALVGVFWKMKEHFPNEVDDYISQYVELKTTHSNLKGSLAHEMVPKFTSNSFETDVQPNLDQEQIFNRMDLRTKDLSNRKLNGASFCQLMGLGTIFSGSSLDHSDFSQAYLEEAKFKNVSAVSTYFDRADLTKANMRFSNFHNANFEFSNLTGANFTGANLEGATFQWANLSGTNFTDANLIGAKFFNSFLSGTIFLNAIADSPAISKEMLEFNFEDINFTEVRYQRHWNFGFPNANFTRAKLHGLTLNGKDFSGSNFTGAGGSLDP